MKRHLLTLAALAAALCASFGVSAQSFFESAGLFNIRDIGSPNGLRPWSINDLGDIVGENRATDSGLLLRSDGTVVNLTDLRIALGINNNGEILGALETGARVFRTNVGVSIPLDSPFVFGLNDSGLMAGTAGSRPQGMIRDLVGVRTLFDHPLPDSQTGASGISASGQVSGTVRVVSGSTESLSAFVRAAGGSFDTYRITPAFAKVSQDTAATGLNDRGVSVGEYGNFHFDRTHGYLRSTRIGGVSFVVNLDPADSVASQEVHVRGVNALNQVVGEYRNADGDIQGFIATPKFFVARDVLGRADIASVHGSGRLLEHDFVHERDSIFVSGAPDSLVVLEQFTDSALFTLRAGTLVNVGDLDAYAGAPTFIELVRGTIHATFDRLKPRSKFELRTPVAVAGHRGTDFEVSYEVIGGLGVFNLTVFEGGVDVTDPLTGLVTLLGAGEHFSISAPVPEPLAWAQMVAGLAVLWLGIRRVAGRSRTAVSA